MLRKLLFAFLLVSSGGMNVYSLGKSLLRSDVIRENIQQLEQLPLPRFLEDQVVITMRKSINNRIQVEVIVGRFSNQGDEIEQNVYYMYNAAARKFAHNIAQDLIRNVHCSDLQEVKRYCLEF